MKLGEKLKKLDIKRETAFILDKKKNPEHYENFFEGFVNY